MKTTLGWHLWLVWGSLHLTEVWSLETGGRFSFGAYDRNLTSVAVKKFLYLSYIIKRFYQFCTWKAILKDNVMLQQTVLLFKTEKV
jgi:hypothetical protein